MLEVGFAAKANSLAPRPIFLYLEAQMCDRNVSWVDKENAFFHEPKIYKEVGACRRVERANSSTFGLERMSRMI